MATLPKPQWTLTTSASANPRTQRQLSMTFESPTLQDLTPTERAGAVEQLANLLLQAAGMQAEGGDHDKR